MPWKGYPSHSGLYESIGEFLKKNDWKVSYEVDAGRHVHDIVASKNGECFAIEVDRLMHNPILNKKGLKYHYVSSIETLPDGFHKVIHWKRVYEEDCCV